MLVRDRSRGHGLRDNRISMHLHALDAWVREPSVLTDVDRLREILHAGARAGGATVVGEEFHVFPNGAVTGVLVLAQSHLSIHTWPELALANVDLLSYGDLRAERALRVICELLDVEHAAVTHVPRAIG
ncbi:MAG: adenosylmethionine decarboxylase [Gaiellaceae bacterium]